MELYFILKYAWDAVRACRDMGGFLPSILIAQFCLETGYGRGSGCAALVLWFNLLGMKAELHKFFKSAYWDGRSASKTTPEYYGSWTTITDAFCVYTSAYQCCMDFLSFMKDGIVSGGKYKYRDLMSCTDYKVIARELRARGYATDPSYDKKLNNIIEKYNLTIFDRAFVPEKPTIIDRVALNTTRVPAHNANSHKYLAIHYLGVEGENPDLVSGGYGGHFYVSKDGKCYQSALVTDKIWHVGASSGFKYIHSAARNDNTIGIECATYKKDGKWYFTEATQKACAALAACLMFLLGIPEENLLRHGDITTKHCPAPYIDYEGQGTNWTWARFKEEVKKNMSNDKRILKRGCTGEDVRDLQERMMLHGFCDCQDYKNPGKFCDGDFGGRTEAYVMMMQEALGLDNDGIFGPLTRAALEKLDALVAASDVSKIKASDMLRCAEARARIYAKEKHDYGNPPIAPQYCRELKIACDRGVVEIAYDAGFRDIGNRECSTLDDYFISKGGKLFTNLNEARAGDILWTNNGNHVFLCAGTNKRFDFGSRDRIRLTGAYSGYTSQPFTEPVVGWRRGVHPAYAPEEETTGKLYQVQAGLFSVKANAEHQVERLKAAGFDALINVIEN